MPATVEKLGPNRVRLEVDVPRDRFQESIEKVYRDSRSHFMIDGFRRGKAPRAVIESHYGPGVFFQDAFDDLFPDVYRDAVMENDLVPVGPPENLQYLEVDGDKGVRFTVEVSTFPEVRLGNYTGLKAKRAHHTVTDEEVAAQLARLQEENAGREQTEGPAEDKDTLDIDFAGTIDGEPFEGGSAEHQQLTLGSGRFIDGFETQLLGAVPGEERDVTVTFPENYQAEDLAGREAVFHVTVNSISRAVLPELDDDFAEDVSEFDTLGELEDDLRAKLQEQHDQRQEAALESELVSQVAENTEIDLPPVMIEGEIDEMLTQLRQQLIYTGLSLEDFLKMQNTDITTFREAQRDDAERTLKTRLVIEELVNTLETMPDDEEVDGLIDAYAEERGQDKEKVRSTITEQQRSVLAYREAVRKMLTKLKEMSDIEDTEEEITEDAAQEESEN